MAEKGLAMAEEAKRAPGEREYTEIVRMLLERGADINAKDEWGRTALMIGADEGYSDLVLLLLDWEADVHLRDERGYTALMFAAWKGHLDVVKALIERGADVNGVDNKRGYTALLLAAGGPAQHDLQEYPQAGARGGDDDDEMEE